MATVLEELLISVGVRLDRKSLDDARDSVHKDLQTSRKDEKEQGKKNKGLKAEGKARGGINKEREKKKKIDEQTKKDEAEKEERQKRVNKTLKEATGLLGGVAKGWIGAGVAAAAYTVKMTQGNDSLAKFGRTYDVQTDELQAWEFAAKKTGSSSEALRGSLANIGGVIGGIESGLTPFNAGLARLGIDIWKLGNQAKTPLEILEQVAEATKDMSSGSRLAILGQIGIDSSLVNLISEARFEREALLREGRGVGIAETPELTSAEEFYDESLALWTEIRKDTSGVRTALTNFSTEAIKMFRFFRGSQLAWQTPQESKKIIGKAREEWREQIRVGTMNVNLNKLDDPVMFSKTLREQIMVDRGNFDTSTEQ